MAQATTHQVGQRLKAEILSHSVKVIGDKEAVEFACECEDGENVRALVWLSKAAAGMARQQLKQCGFDPDMNSLSDLNSEPLMLSGNEITLEVDEYNNRLQYRIPTSTAVPKKRLVALDSVLREAKKDGEAAVSAKKAKPKANADGEPDEDDIPF